MKRRAVFFFKNVLFISKNGQKNRIKKFNISASLINHSFPQLVITLFCILQLSSTAQTYDAKSVDGRVLVKYRDEVKLILPKSSSVDVKTLPFISKTLNHTCQNNNELFKTTVNTQSFRKGIYILEIKTNKEVIKKQVIIH